MLSAPTVSRAFQEFAIAHVPTRIYKAMIKRGYAAEGGVQIRCLVASASLNDSQAAITLASLTEQRVDA